MEKLIGNFPPYTRLKNQTEQIWVNMRTLLHKTHNFFIKLIIRSHSLNFLAFLWERSDTVNAPNISAMPPSVRAKTSRCESARSGNDGVHHTHFRKILRQQKNPLQGANGTARVTAVQLHLGEAEVQIHICQSFSEHPQR
jgi:hypothetical protein